MLSLTIALMAGLTLFLLGLALCFTHGLPASLLNIKWEKIRRKKKEEVRQRRWVRYDSRSSL